MSPEPASSASTPPEGIARDPAHRLDRRVLLLWWSTSALWVLLVAGGAVVVLVVSALPAWAPAAVAVALIAAALALPPLRYRRWRYEIRERDLFLSRGRCS